MPRYLVEQSRRDRLQLPLTAERAAAWLEVVEINAEYGVTWLHTYVAADHARAFCICDAPSPEALRSAARRTNLPVDRITEVRVIDPYFEP